MPSERRETTCVLAREGEAALALDAGTGFRRLVTEPELLDGARRLDTSRCETHRSRPSTRPSSARCVSSGEQRVGDFVVSAREQTRHCAPTAGLRVGDAPALITDAGFDPGSGAFAAQAAHLPHEAWTKQDSAATDNDATAADAGSIAVAAGARRLTLVHLHPLGDDQALAADARAHFPSAAVGEDDAAPAFRGSRA
jgi:ribonuclease BN (tRNA processing enzyme)